MKTLKAVLPLAILLLFPLRPAFAAENFWATLETALSKCVVQPYRVSEDGKAVYLPLRSVCSEVRASEGVVELSLPEVEGGKTLTARIQDAELSDGGDLNDIIVTEATGKEVAVRRNVPAFGDVLLGLLGGDGHLNVPLALE